MRQIVESLKRLYKDKKINEEVILTLCNNKKISEEEKEYILSTN